MAREIPRFTRRDFQYIADTIKEATVSPVGSGKNTYSERVNMTQAFVNRLKATNPNFRASTFVLACGVQLEDIEGIN